MIVEIASFLFLGERNVVSLKVSFNNWRRFSYEMDTNAVRPITNKCLYFNERSKECIIFDPGHEGEKLVTYLQEEQLKPLAVLLTHAHFDHIGAVDAVRDAFIFLCTYIKKKQIG